MHRVVSVPAIQGLSTVAVVTPPVCGAKVTDTLAGNRPTPAGAHARAACAADNIAAEAADVSNAGSDGVSDG